MKPKEEIKIWETNVDNRAVIEVKGMRVVLSEHISSIENFLTNSAVEEVRIYAAESFEADANLTCDVWHGRNLVVLANEIKVSTTVTWDVSGKDNDHTYTSDAGIGADGHGKDGSDGYPGEMGGNVLVMGNAIEHPERLTIISNGGNGSGGQNGGNGKDGTDGKGIGMDELEECFPSCLKFWRGTRIDRVTKTVENIYDIAESVKIQWMKKKSLGYDRGDYVTADLLKHLKDKNFFDIYLNVVTRAGNEIFFSLWDELFQCHSLLLYKGSPGHRGKSGGGYGMGGQGGFPGEITVMTLNGDKTFNICSHKNWGNDGKNGQGGLNGCYGKNGWDMAFLGQLWKEPKVFGKDQNSKLQLSFSFEQTSNSIYHPHTANHSAYNKYVSMNNAEIDSPSIIRERNNAVARNERQNHSKAVGKKSVSRMRMVAAFSEYLQEIDREKQEMERECVAHEQQRNWQNEKQKHKKQRIKREKLEKLERQLATRKAKHKQRIDKEKHSLNQQQCEKEMRGLEKQRTEENQQGIGEELQQIEKENQVLEYQQLIEFFENNALQQDVEKQYTVRDCLTDVEIKRFANFSQDTIDQNRFEFVKLDESNGNSNQDEIFPILENRFNPDKWVQLQCRIVDFHQLEPLVKHFETYKPWLYLSHGFRTDNNDTIKTIGNILKIKYKLSVLRQIAQVLPIHHTEMNRQTLTAQNAMRYLEETVEQGDPIHHSVLGALRQYIFENSPEQRSKIAKFVATPSEDNYNACKRATGAYILEVQSSETENERVKQCYENYQEFVKAQQNKIDSLTESLVTELKKSKHMAAFRQWNESVDNNVLPKDLERTIRQDKSLSSLYDKLTREKNAEYDWERSLTNKKIQKQFKTYLEQEGVTSKCYRVLLAYVYDVNIRVYARNEDNEYVLREDHNPKSTKATHILSKANEFIQLKANETYRYLEQERLHKDETYRRILTEMSAMQSISNMKRYLKKELFNHNNSSFVEGSGEINEESTIKRIAAFFPIEEREAIAQRLKSISAQYTGQHGVFESLLERFSFEGRHVSFNELCFLINSILSHTVEARQERYTFSWIISAYNQCNWTDELVLLQLENCFKQQLKEKSKWSSYMSKIHNKGVLLVFAAQLARKPCPAECVEEILYLLSSISIKSVCLDQLQLTEWPYALKEYYWTSKLKSLVTWDKKSDMLTSASFYIMSIENTYGDNLMDVLFESLKENVNDLTHDELMLIFSSLHAQKWSFSMDDKNVLQESGLKKWIKHMEDKFKINLEELNVVQLVSIIRGNANTSSKMMKHFPQIQTSVTRIHRNNTFVNEKSISSFSSADIKEWVKAFRDSREIPTAHKYEEMLAVVDRAIEHTKEFRLRDTQRLTVLAMLANDNKTLAQVSTGEGKTLIVVATAIIKGLLGEKVDIITSSSLLAQRDAISNKDIYQLFGLNVSHNCREILDERKEAYSCNQIMYGDLANFQRDYMLDRFYGKHVLGDRSFETVIVDEVDSMLLDKGNNMLYLSHDIAGMDKLETLYVFIWQKVNSLTDLTEDEAVETIKRSVLSDMYPSIQKEDIASLASAMEKSIVLRLWERLVKSGIISFSGRLLAEEIDSKKLDEALTPDYTQYKDRLNFLLWSRIERDALAKVPNYLKPFVERHLDGWISSALTALYMVPGQYYVVDVDRSGTSADRHANVIILDRDTGTDQLNSQWDEALHQFLQLKHGCKLSTQNLKAVFISNVTYLKMYKLLYGLSGTLGSQRERHLLKQIHQVDFVTIPTAKTKQFEEYEPIICSNEEDWKQQIRQEVNKMIKTDKRSVLIICETIRNVESLKQIMNSGNHTNVHTYVRDYEKFTVSEGYRMLEQGQIIIATNLAGRGTDIKLSNKLRDAGGLHVILTYLPANIRVEEQAFGRAARSGNKGSGRMIIMVTNGDTQDRSLIFTLKQKRNVDELFRVSAIKSYYETTIKTEEDCFKAFNEVYDKKVKCLANADTPDPVKEILLQSCLDKWSFWLDEHNSLIGRSSGEATQRQVKQLLDQFITQFDNLEATDANCWPAWVEGNPIQMIKLGKYLSQHESKYYATALRLFGKVIESEPEYCEAAYYYRAYTRLLDDMNRKPFENDLRMTESLLHRHIKSSMHASGIVEILKTSTRQDGGYEEQKKNLIDLYLLFIRSIDDMLGHAITPDSFVNDEIKEDVAEKIFNDLIQIGMIKKAKMIGNVTDVQLQELHFEYGTSVERLKEFLYSHIGTTDEKELLGAVRKSFSFPSRVEFWETLVKQKVLHSVEEYVAIDEERLETEELAIMTDLKEMLDKGRLVKETVKLEKNQIMLLHEQHSLAYFDKKKLIENIGRANINFFEEKGVFLCNKKATIDKSKIAGCVFSVFDSITALDITTMTRITAIEANNIINELVEQKVLEKRGNSFALSVDHDRDILLSPYPVYENVIRSVLASCFAYSLALRDILIQLEDEECSVIQIELTPDPHRMLFYDLLDAKIVQPPTLNETFNVDDAVRKVCSKQRFLINSTVAHHIKKVLKTSKPSLAAYKKSKANLKSIVEVFGKGNFGNIDEMRIFITNGLEHLLELAEKKWTVEMITSLSAVVCIGLAQIAIGAIIKLCFVGRSRFAKSLVKEGINDVMFAVNAGRSGEFTWKKYGKQKWQRFLFTVCNTCKDTMSANEAKQPLKNYKVAGPRLQRGGQTTANSTGKLLVKPVGGRTELREAVKRISQKTAEGVAFATSQASVDKLVVDHLQNQLSSFTSDFLSGVQEEVANHKVFHSLQKAYYILGANNTKDLVNDLTNKYMMEQMISQTFLPIVKQVILIVKNEMKDAIENADEASSAMLFITRLNLAMVFVDCAKQVFKMRIATQKLLNSVNAEIGRKLADIEQNATTSTEKKVILEDFGHFYTEVVEEWKTKLSEHVGHLIAQYIVQPILKAGVNSLISSMGISLKSMIDLKLPEDTCKLITKPVLKTDHPNMTVQTKRQLTEKYHGQLLKMTHKTRCPALFATMIRENILMDMACVSVCAVILHKILQSRNPTITGVTITVHEEKGMKKSFSSGNGGSEIYLTLINNHFTVSPVEGCRVNTAESNCLSEALATALPESQWMKQKLFRSWLINYIENDESIQDHIRQNMHRVSFEQGAVGGAKSKRTQHVKNGNRSFRTLFK